MCATWHESAFLPVTDEMAWTVPQLLKRVQPVSPGIRSTTGVLRALILVPELDGQFVKAFTDSGFLSCDEAIARVRWKLDLGEMEARHRDPAGPDVPAHCRALLARHHAGKPFDWDAVLVGLRTLNALFPELRTIELLERLYTRLHVLHLRSVDVARSWLHRHARVACVSQGGHHA
jgi:hypothetical protein